MPATNDTARGGIYQIRCLKNGKVYIGSAVKFADRWRNHRKLLRRGSHHSQYLQAAWNKHGPESFVFEIVEFVDTKDELPSREQSHMDGSRSYDREFGYNMRPKAYSPLGVPISPETREKLREAQKGRVKSPEELANVRAALAKRWADPEFRAKMTDVLIRESRRRPRSLEERAKLATLGIGRIHSDETKAKLSAALKGRKLSEEHKANLSIALKGRKPPTLSPESRARKAAALRGRKRSPEHIAKSTAARNAKRQPVSEETKAKMSESAKRRAATPEGKVHIKAASALGLAKRYGKSPDAEGGGQMELPFVD